MQELIILIKMLYVFTANIEKVVEADVSCYTSEVNQTDSTPFITASGERVGRYTIANNILGFGRQVMVTGSPYIVKDRMNPRYNDGWHFDIWMDDYNECIKFGRQTLPVIIWK